MNGFEKFYNRVLRFLSFRPRSEKEIRNFLKKKKIDEKTSTKIINKLKKLNFVDDVEFAKWWVEQRQGGKPRGMRVIKMELKQKGISEEVIQSSIRQLADKVQSELDLAKRAVLKKVDAYRKLSIMEFKQKLSQFLLRRGFDWETVKEVVDEILKKEYNASGRS